MKQCPQCGREYDPSMMFCLDDGAELLYGPASDEPATAIMSEPASNENLTATIPSTRQTGETAAELPASKSSKRKLWIAVGAVVLIGAASLAGYRYFGSGAAHQLNSVAVLPFVNETGDPNSEYLSDGMTETLISSLSRIPELSVRARSSVFRFKGASTDIHDIAKQLNVGAIVSGRVTQRGQELSLYAELIDIMSDKVTWSKTYNRSTANLVALQGEIANDLVQALRTNLSASVRQSLTQNGTTNAEAYQYYLQGQYHFKKRGPVEVGRAIDNFKQAIAIDPNYALAYAALAGCYSVDSSPEPAGPGRSAKEKAAATKAIELDPNLGEAHRAMATVFVGERKWSEAEGEFQRAIQLNPKDAEAYHWYGEMLGSIGRRDESITHIDKAIELDPYMLVFNADRIYLLYLARRYDEAIAQAKKVIDLDPNVSVAYWRLVNIYCFKGMYIEAADEMDHAAEVSRNMDPATKTLIKQSAAAARESFKTSGPRGYWKEMLDLELKWHADQPDSWYLAVIYAQLGEKDEAFKWLEKVVDDPRVDSVEIKYYPGFDPIRDDPRFGELVKKAGYPWP